MVALCDCKTPPDAPECYSDRRTDLWTVAGDLAAHDLPERTHRTTRPALTALVPSSPNPPIDMGIESVNAPSIKQEFFNRIRPSLQSIVAEACQHLAAETMFTQVPKSEWIPLVCGVSQRAEPLWQSSASVGSQNATGALNEEETAKVSPLPCATARCFLTELP